MTATLRSSLRDIRESPLFIAASFRILTPGGWALEALFWAGWKQFAHLKCRLHRPEGCVASITIKMNYICSNKIKASCKYFLQSTDKCRRLSLPYTDRFGLVHDNSLHHTHDQKYSHHRWNGMPRESVSQLWNLLLWVGLHRHGISCKDIW